MKKTEDCQACLQTQVYVVVRAAAEDSTEQNFQIQTDKAW